MKIGNPPDKPAPPVVANGAPRANGATHAVSAGSHAAKADPSATIELSNTAATLLPGGATADFDAEKVTRIAKAIDDGTFRINPGAIADKLISNARELLSKVQA